MAFPVLSQITVADLSEKLTAALPSEREKVSAIFHWITSHIAYRVKPGKQAVIGAASRRNTLEPVEDLSPLKPLNERVAETVLEKRVAVCDGYARLFTTLCDHAGIRSEVIIGYARTSANRQAGRFAVNHYWNAVMIDNHWYLLDATWASGYLSRDGSEFIRDYDPRYFLTPAKVFIRDHYPDDARWTLLPDAEVPEEFRSSPFRLKSFSKYRISSFYPSLGVIETFVGDTIRLQLETAVTEAGRDIVPDLLIDSALFTHSPSWVFLRPEHTAPVQLAQLYTYTYTIASPEVAWLYLLYNDDLVLRYKLNVKKRGS
jgi:hypothetical protein